MSQQYTQFDPEEARKRRNEHRRLLMQNLTPEERERMLERRRNNYAKKQNPSADASQADLEEARKLKNERRRLLRQNLTPEEREKMLERRRNNYVKKQNPSPDACQFDLEEARKLTNERRRLLRKRVTKDQRERANERRRNYHKLKRLQTSEEELAKKRQQRREYRRRTRNHLSEQEKQNRRERHQIYERSREHNLAEVDKIKMRESNRLLRRAKRHQTTSEDKIQQIPENSRMSDALKKTKPRYGGTERSKCPVCFKYFFTSSLQSHMINHLPRAALPFQCQLCKMGFNRHGALRNHYREYHAFELPMTLSTFSCDLCSVTVETRVKYIDHIREHVAAGDAKIGEYEEMLFYQCDAQSCFICFRDKTMFDHHVVTAHPNSIICDTCGKVFAVVENYENHVTVAHTSNSSDVKELEVTCDYCWQIINESEIERHRKQHVLILSEVPTPGFVCQDCGKAFASEVTMMKHMKNVHTDKHKTGSTTCQVCKTQFKSMKSLHSHYLNVHTYDHPLVCHICSKEFSYLYLLNSHLRGHEGQGRQTKYHDCGYCTKSFSFHVHRNQHQVLAHASIHLANRPFYCPACFRAFQYESLYNDHMMTHEKFRCHICKEYFLGKQGLNSHMPGHMRSNGPLKRFDFELVRKAKEERLKEVGTLIDTPVVTSGKEMLNLIVKSRKRDLVTLRRRRKKNSIELQDNEDKFQDNEDKFQDNGDIDSDKDNSQSEREDIIDLSEEATTSSEKIVAQNDIPIEGQGQGLQVEIPADVIEMFENTKQLMYICNQCPAQFSSTLSLCEHLNYHDAQKNGQFHEVDRLRPAALTRINLDKIDYRSLRDKYLNPNCKLFECEICKITVLSKIHFINHMNDHETSEDVTGSGILEIKQNQQTNHTEEIQNTKMSEEVSKFLKTNEDYPVLARILIEVTRHKNQPAQKLQNDKVRADHDLGTPSYSSMDRLTSLYLRYQMNSVSSQSSLIASTGNVSDSTGSAGGYNAMLNEWDDRDENVPLVEYLDDPLEDPLANTAEDTFRQRIADASEPSGLRVVPLTFMARGTEEDVQLGEVEVKDEPIQEEFLLEVPIFEMEDSEEPGSNEAVRRRASAFESLLSGELIHKVKALPFLTVQLQRLSENVIPGLRVSASSFKIKTEPKDDSTTRLPISPDVHFGYWQDDRHPEVTSLLRKSKSKATKRAIYSNRKIKSDGSSPANSESPAVCAEEDSSPGNSDSDSRFSKTRKRRRKGAGSGSPKKEKSRSPNQERSGSPNQERSGRTKKGRSGRTKKLRSGSKKKRSARTKKERSASAKKETPTSTEKDRSASPKHEMPRSTTKAGEFSCPRCDKTFEQTRSLQNHIRVHPNESDEYPCTECDVVYSTSKELLHHLREKHLQECPTCKKRFPASFPLQAHIQRCSSNPYNCSVCSKSYNLLQSLKVHQRKVHGRIPSDIAVEHMRVGPFHCHICSKTFDYKKRFDRHLRVHLKAGELASAGPTFFTRFCDGNGCSMQFIHKETFLRHLETHPPSGIPYSCVSCPKVFAEAQSLQSHAQRVHEQNEIDCPYCPNSFTVDAAVQEHIESIHKLDLSVSLDGDFICDACGQSFCEQRTLDRHKAMEHGHLIGGAIRNRIPYWRKALGGKVSNNEKCSCPVCGKTIGVRSRANHLLSEHTYEHGLSCFICLRQFSRYGRLALHLKEHAQGGLVPPDVILPSKPERIHKKRAKKSCRFCGEVFCDQLREFKHYFNYHPTEYLKDTPFYCVHCYRAFPTTDDLETHQAKIHDHLKCEECGKQFLSIDSLRAHVQHHRR